MVDILKYKLGRFFFKDTYARLEQTFKVLEGKIDGIDERVNRRAAEIVSKMDPWAPLMREFHGIFTAEYERPEDRLDSAGKIRMMMWGYQQNGDPAFNQLMDWIVNTQGNASVKKGNPTSETILFSRAMIAAPLLVKKEVQRLSSLYEEFLANRNEPDPDEAVAVE